MCEKAAWIISSTGAITIYTFNESLCGEVMAGYRGTLEEGLDLEEGVTGYINSLR